MKETLLDTTYRRQTKKLRTKTESLWAIMGGPTAWGTGSALHVVKVHFYSQFLSKKHTYVFPTIISIIHHKFLDICAFSIQMLLDLKLGQISAENVHAVLGWWLGVDLVLVVHLYGNSAFSALVVFMQWRKVIEIEWFWHMNVFMRVIWCIALWLMAWC